jgi:hypothetical protein
MEPPSSASQVRVPSHSPPTQRCGTSPWQRVVPRAQMQRPFSHCSPAAHSVVTHLLPSHFCEAGVPLGRQRNTPSGAHSPPAGQPQPPHCVDPGPVLSHTW